LTFFLFRAGQKKLEIELASGEVPLPEEEEEE